MLYKSWYSEWLVFIPGRKKSSFWVYFLWNPIISCCVSVSVADASISPIYACPRHQSSRLWPPQSFKLTDDSMLSPQMKYQERKGLKWETVMGLHSSFSLAKETEDDNSPVEVKSSENIFVKFPLQLFPCEGKWNKCISVKVSIKTDAKGPVHLHHPLCVSWLSVSLSRSAVWLAFSTAVIPGTSGLIADT